MAEICKVCGKSYKQITAMHVRTHGMNLEQYEAFDPHAPKKDIEPKGNTEVTLEQREENIWGDQERDVERPLSNFLKEFDITETELREVARKFKSGRHIDPKIDAANKEKIAVSEVEELKDKDEVEVFRAETAELLKMKYGFIGVSSKGGPPKSWILRKK